jgi:hypothetical protein
MKKSKYRAIKTVVDGIAFDSKGEAARYCELKLLLKSCDIKNLRLQVKYDIVPSVIINGRKKPAVRYIADFVYEQGGITIVEDFKGRITPVYSLKRHLMKHVHNIDIFESH